MARKTKRKSPKSDGPSEEVPRAGSELTMPVPRDEDERKIVESIGSRSRLVYILIAMSPLSCLGTHLAYARIPTRGCAGCLGFLALLFVLVAAPSMASLLGEIYSVAQSVGEQNPNDVPRGSAIALVAVVGFLWFLGICAGLRWTFLGSAAWKRGQVARATAQIEAKREEERNKAARRAAAIEAKREKERNEAEESARRAKAAKQMAELAEMRHAEERREQARRDAALVPLYGGEVRFVEMVKKGSIALGMTRAAVEASWGSPADIREEISASRHRVRLFFGREVGARGKVTYRHEVVLLGNRVVSIKDL
jgi:hypothetical protein